MSAAPDPERWDVFCRVVDNFGDVGVAWRLSRQLAREHGKRTRLWLDDLTVLARLRPEIDAALESQQLEGVEVARLHELFDAGDVADVVVETFGCEAPEAYMLAMAARAHRPRWINLDYLSAEEWVEGSHALPSPHPRLPLTKHYFFPGFTAKTGGLLREHRVLNRRDEFQADAGAQAAFWTSLVGKPPPTDALRVSLFGYAGAPFEALARSCMQHPGPVWLIAPEGAASAALRTFASPLHDVTRRNSHAASRRREMEVFLVDFLTQDRYDQLLWACDVNFVRGEDSFVRAQWAARPFVWNIYPTDDGAHWVKMAAFLARYTEGLERSHAGAVTGLWEAWNRLGEEEQEGGRTPPSVGDAWAAFSSRRQVLEDHTRAWTAQLASRRGLAEALVDFADNVLK